MKQIRALSVSVQSCFFGYMEVLSGKKKEKRKRIVLTVTFWINISLWKNWRNFFDVKPFVGNSWPTLIKSYVFRASEVSQTSFYVSLHS